MQVIKSEEALQGKNSEQCKTIEYSFNDTDIDLGVATITGRFPEKGLCKNTVSKELIYVIEGTGKLHFENDCVEFSKGDSILIEPNDLYYWDTDYCVVSMSCTPAWSEEQHQIIE